jgi:hypothetical protein
VHRNSDGPGLVGNGPGDGLTDPPGGVGAEFVPPAVFELVHRLHQPDVALLNEIQKLEAAVGVLLGDADHQPEVGPNQFTLGEFGPHPTFIDAGHDPFEVAVVGLEIVFFFNQLIGTDFMWL